MAFGDIILGSALKGTLLSVNRTQDTIDGITRRLASGLKVNSAIDQPQNFFTARSLQFAASDQARLLDGIGQSIRTVQEAISGLEAIGHLINQGEALVTESEKALLLGEIDDAGVERVVDITPLPLSDLINLSAPDTYFRLNETAGPIQDYGTQGPVTANYAGGASPDAPPLYINGAAPSVEFDGVNDRILVTDAPHINLVTTTARTVELIFSADSVTGRRVLYEEGAGTNGFTIYLDGDTLYVTGEDDQGAQRWVNANINSSAIGVQIQTGQTYHASFVYNAATDSFSGYLDGVLMGSVTTDGAPNFPPHSGNIGIGAAVDGVQFHDGEAGAGFYFDGRISDVAIYNRALGQGELANHANSLNSTTTTIYENVNYNTLLDQIDNIVVDAHYRGINLLAGEDLLTIFNATQSSTLLTEGQNFSTKGLGLVKRLQFNNLGDVRDILSALRSARAVVREYAFTLANELSIVEARNSFTRDLIYTNLAGADDLTVADMNKEGAHQLAAQTRLNLGITALNLAGLSQGSILNLVG
ncbi:MAG: hypothetical protein H6861_01445 [Rhodospirillales bacterium]|nr:hypothetical protein [Rhodospirillales bacterium]